MNLTYETLPCDEFKLQEALNYITANPTLSFHHVAVKFGIEAKYLQKAWEEHRRNTLS
ncbi:MAG TPA: hypothetical protein VFM18_22405 [Methanosarcina sp.]|nr:hypothetical protein [Methanosarcina sp.]